MNDVQEQVTRVLVLCLLYADRHVITTKFSSRINFGQFNLTKRLTITLSTLPPPREQTNVNCNESCTLLNNKVADVHAASTKRARASGKTIPLGHYLRLHVPTWIKSNGR